MSVYTKSELIHLTENLVLVDKSAYYDKNEQDVLSADDNGEFVESFRVLVAKGRNYVVVFKPEVKLCGLPMVVLAKSFDSPTERDKEWAMTIHHMSLANIRSRYYMMNRYEDNILDSMEYGPGQKNVIRDIVEKSMLDYNRYLKA